MPGKPPLFERLEGPPPLVMGAVALLSLVFVLGAVYLLRVTPLSGVSVTGPAELPAVTAVLTDYEGPLPGMENARVRVRNELARVGVSPGRPLTLFPVSPLRLRPIAVKCRLGYLVESAPGPEFWPPELKPVRLDPGVRWVVRVTGTGNFTGAKAYKAAARVLESRAARPGDGERYEIQDREARIVEHWIPR